MLRQKGIRTGKGTKEKSKKNQRNWKKGIGYMTQKKEERSPIPSSKDGRGGTGGEIQIKLKEIESRD